MAQSIKEKCHKPITEMPLDELGYILLEKFSESGGFFNVRGILKPESNNDNSTYLALLEALQWLSNHGLVMNEFEQDSHQFYRITRKGQKALEDGNPFNL